MRACCLEERVGLRAGDPRLRVAGTADRVNSHRPAPSRRRRRHRGRRRRRRPGRRRRPSSSSGIACSPSRSPSASASAPTLTHSILTESPAAKRDSEPRRTMAQVTSGPPPFGRHGHRAADVCRNGAAIVPRTSTSSEPSEPDGPSASHRSRSSLPRRSGRPRSSAPRTRPGCGIAGEVGTRARSRSPTANVQRSRPPESRT